uniref:Uncharacterized protein n=1 Tax=Salarias fasciatus TaxID=181472 RepID=A0A672FGN3_SALFA
MGCERKATFYPCILSSLLTVSLLVSATVSHNFKGCSHFFYMETPPAGITGTGLRRICQRYADKMRCATLYDSSRRAVCQKTLSGREGTPGNCFSITRLDRHS